MPNPESALNEEAGKLLLEQYDSYAHQARLYTKIHAKTGKQEYISLAAERGVARPGKDSQNENPPASNNNEDVSKPKENSAKTSNGSSNNNVLTTSAANNAFQSNSLKRSATESQEGKDTLDNTTPAKQPKIESPLKKRAGPMADRKKNLRRL